MTMTVNELLDKIEECGFRDDIGHPLTNMREWHELRSKFSTKPPVLVPVTDETK